MCQLPIYLWVRSAFFREAVLLSNQSFVPFVLICLLSCKQLRTTTGPIRFHFPSHKPSKKKMSTPIYLLEVVVLQSRFAKTLNLKLFISTSYRVGRSSVRIDPDVGGMVITKLLPFAATAGGGLMDPQGGAMGEKRVL